MSDLEKEVWVFPIYKHGRKKYIPLLYSLILAYIIPTAIVILLSPFSRTNAFLYQIEYILLAISFTLVGILTRSKLRGFLNIIPAVASYLTIELVLQSVFSPPIANPYSIFNVIAQPLGVALTNLNLGIDASLLQSLIIVDIIIIGLIAFIGGFFASMIATGFWDKHGHFKFISVLAKMVAIPLALIFLIVLPIALHAVGSIASGTSYLAAGATELSIAFGASPGASSAQGFDITSIDIEELRTRSLAAANYFSQADVAFQQLSGNFIVGAILSSLGQINPQLQGFENATVLLSAIGILTEVTFVLPELFIGFDSFQKGFESTFGIMGGGTGSNPTSTQIMTKPSFPQQATYDPAFKDGLLNLEYAFDNFSAAWELKNNETGEIHGIKAALARASNFQDFESLSQFINLADFFEALEVTVEILLEAGEAIIPFINGTYKTTLGLQALGDNNFDLASTWIESGLEDFTTSNMTFSSIDKPKPVNITIGQGADATVISIPIDGVIEIATDLNNLLLSFGYGANAGIKFFSAMSNIASNLEAINMSDTSATTGTGNQTTWDGLNQAVTDATTIYNQATGNISEAGMKADFFLTKSYGDFLDPAFVEGDDAFFSQVSTMVTDYQGNLTDFGHLLNAIGNTSLAFQDFGLGSSLFEPGKSALSPPPGDNTTILQSKAKMITSKDYAAAAWNALKLTTAINDELKLNWLASLGDPGIPYKLDDIGTTESSIQAVTSYTIELIDILTAFDTSTVLFELILELMDGIDLGAIGGG